MCSYENCDNSITGIYENPSSRADSRLAPTQWETSLQSNLESALFELLHWWINQSWSQLPDVVMTKIYYTT